MSFTTARSIKEGRDWFLRVYIDKTAPDGYARSTEDCEKVSEVS